MKIHIIVLSISYTLGICILLIIGCGGDLQDLNTYDNTEPFTAIDTNSYWVENGYSTEDGYCSQILHIGVYGMAPSYGNWYAVGLYQNGKLLAQSDIEFLRDTIDVEFSILVGDFAGVDDGPYKLCAFGSEDFQSAGIVQKRSTIADYYNIDIFGLTSWGCAAFCMDTYGYAIISDSANSNIVGSYCIIDTRYDVKLCGDPPDDTSSAHSVVYTEIEYDTTYIDHYGKTKSSAWVQTGYGTTRWTVAEAGSVFVSYHSICEMRGYYHHLRASIDIYPQGPSAHSYRQFLGNYGTSDGRWFTYLDNDTISIAPYDPIWDIIEGSKVSFGAEIRGSETDMVGAISNPCIITDCSFDTGTGMVNMGLTQMPVIRGLITDSAKWMIDIIDDTTLAVWDVIPRP